MSFDSVISSKEISSSLSWIREEEGKAATRSIQALRIASYLTDPVCKVREYVYSFYLLDSLCQTTWQKVKQAAFLTFGILIFALLTPFTAPVGIGIRALVAHRNAKPFLFLKKEGKGKELPENRQISWVSHNICLVPGGYAITDGQVTPSSDAKRLQKNLQAIQALDPDVVCLFEVSDILDAEKIGEQLPDYPFVIPVAGMRAVGPSSMMYIASKYEIVEDSIAFIPFIKNEELTGRARFSEKGFLSFDLKSAGTQEVFATLIATHLQHSEVPAVPNEEEPLARAKQMAKIFKHIEEKQRLGRNILFTGDLNQVEEELESFCKQHREVELRRDSFVKGIPTWGGDAWCAQFEPKPASGPLVLDYACIAGKAVSISTQVIGTGYEGTEFRADAGSDHSLLYSVCNLGK